MNKWLFKIHGWMALVTFLPLLVICVTGSILVFKHEIDNLLIPDKVRVVVEGHQRLSLDELRYELETSLPDYEPMGWVLFQDVGRADVVYLIKKGTGDWYYTLLDQYRGRLLSPVLTEKDHLTDWLLSLHYTFLMHDTGLLITAALAIVLCLLGITGLILYRKFWKNLFTLRRKARLVVYFSDLHKMAGFYTSPILLILGITGAYWNIVHFVHELEEHKDGAEHYKVEGPLYNTALSLQALHDDAQQQLSGFKPTYLSLPYEPGIGITFFGDVGAGNPLHSEYASTVGYDAQTGIFTGSSDIRSAGLLRKTDDSFRNLHFGIFAGLSSRVLWFFAGLVPVLLAATGLTLWWKRRPQRRAKKAKLRALRQQSATAIQ